MSEADRDRRTHEATPKRRDDFRKRGDIALSRDLVSAATLFGGAMGVIALAPRTARTLVEHLGGQLQALDGATPSFGASLRVAGAAALPLATVALGAATVAIGVQLGWPPVLRGPKFELGRMVSPGALAQMFSPKAAGGRLGKALLKLLAVGLVAGLAVRAEAQRFAASPAVTPGAIAGHLAGAVARVASIAGGALALLGLGDYVIARRRKAAEMRMTPDEVKREHKEQEGDPQVRRRRKQRMRELARRRLASAVKGADVVIVNPTEYAVALRYVAGESRAPKVVAKGRGVVAERIRELARAAGVPILPQPPLARLLHKVVPEGREIPPTLYHAVAEVLAYVYRLRRRRA